MQPSPTPSASTTGVSIALGTFNGARFLAEQLASIATQTMSPVEIVVGDDGSSDATLDIIADFAATVPYPVHVERNPTRLGFGLNFLRILGRCSGDVIILADQDDVWLDHKIEAIMRAFNAKPNASLVTHDAVLVDAERASLGYTVFESYGATRHSVHVVHGAATAVRRSFLDLVPPPGPSFHAHDEHLVAVAEAYATAHQLPEVLMEYRRHAHTASNGVPPPGDLHRTRSSWILTATRATLRTSVNDMRSLLATQRHRLEVADHLAVHALDPQSRSRAALARDRLTRHCAGLEKRTAVRVAPRWQRPFRAASLVRDGTYASMRGHRDRVRDVLSWARDALP